MGRNSIKKLALAALASVACLMPASAGTAWNDLKAGNPVLPGYFADPCVRKFGDTYYLYVTPDGWDVGKGPYCIWTSKDFVHWKSHPSNWPTTELKWAPSVIKHNNKYYMYTQTPCMIWGAVSDTPLGPWTSLSEPGKPMIPDQTPKGSIVLDGEIFIDDDGQRYMWYSTWWTPTVAKLKEDMATIDGEPIQYFKKGDNKTPMGLVQGCMEAPYMFKRNGTYYLMYSNNFCQDSSYRVEYSTSSSPLGPFTYGKNNPILSTNDDDTVDGPGHHTILEDNGKIYIVYHRHDNPHDPDGAHRQTCIDELHFLPDGSIEKIVPTHSGVGFLAPSTVRDTNLAIGKTATASSFAGADFKPSYAADENNGTLWKAKDDSFPQWLMVDLGKQEKVARVETEFQYAQVLYSYLIECSSDGKTWKMFADRTKNTSWGPTVDKASVTARYFRITILGKNTDRKDQRAAIWNLKIYDGIDKPNQAPKVDAGADTEGTINFPTRVVDATINDDGLPNGPVSVKWTKVSGPGDVTFEHPDRAYSKVTFSSAGKYVLKLTGDDGKLKGSDTVTFNILPPTDQLIWYKFDENSGAVANDSSINGQYGVMKIGTARSRGMHGGAINMSGSDFVNVPSLGTQDNLTIATWINPHTLNGHQSIVCSDGENPAVQATIAGTGQISFVANGKSATSNFGLTPDDLGSWKHIAISYDSATKSVSFFVGGKLDSTKPLPEAAKLNLANGLKIGSGQGVRGLDGEIDDFRLYATTISAQQLAEIAKPTKFATIAEVKKQAFGTPVTLMAKAVTFAPRNPMNGERTTDYFYIAERDGSEGIMVRDGNAGQDKVAEDSCVSFEGVVKVNSLGEKYVELTSTPGIGAPCEPKIAGNSLASLIKVKGDVTKLSEDGKWFTLPMNGKETKVIIEKGIITKKIAEGNTVEVTGVLSTSARDAVLLLKDLTRINPPADPLIAYYKFDETSGETARDSSTSNQNGTLKNEPKWINGKVGGGISFDGKNYVEVPDLGLQKAITVAAWINMNSYGPDDFGASILHCDGWDPGDLHMILPKADKNIAIAIGGSNPGDLHSKFKFSDDKFGQWVHIAFTYDTKARTMSLYVNGQLEETKGLSTPCPINMAGAKIGSWGGGARMFDGKMDDFRIYDKALTTDEISRIYESK